MPQTWSDDARRHLLDVKRCPRCEAADLVDGVCPSCRTDLRGAQATQLWTASVAAAQAITAREKIVDALPVVTATGQAAAGTAPANAAPANYVPQAGAASAPQPANAPVPSETSSFTVQSVLAVTGAGLFAVAAIVFTFFNPDLTDTVARSVINGVVTLLFLGSAVLLVRRGLQFSGEAVGALGMVFVALDVYAFSLVAPDDISPWIFAAIGALVAGGILLFLGAMLRLRTWVWLASVGVATTPAMFGYAGETVWSSILGHLDVGVAVLVLHLALLRVGPRFDSRMRADHTALTVLQVIASVVVVAQIPFLTAPTPTQHVLSVVAVLAVLAALSGLAGRVQIALFWNVTAGALAATAAALLPFALDLNDTSWYLALSPAAAGLAFVIAMSLRARTRAVAWIGALVIAMVSAVPALAVAARSVLQLLVMFLLGAEDSPGHTLTQRAFTPGLAAFLGLLAAAGALVVAGRIQARRSRREDTQPPTALVTAGLWVAGPAALAITTWNGLLPVGQVIVGLGLALSISLALRFVPSVRQLSLAWRLPLVALAHVLLVLVAVIAARDDTITVAAGAATIAVLVVAAQTTPVSTRFLHVGIGYAYALAILATGLTQLDLENIVVLCLTSAVGSLVALVATEIRRVSPRVWWAILVVTLVPFVIGVGTVVVDRSGWPALSTGLTGALALTLLLSKRPGLTGWLRAAAAALIVPSLAVVIVTLGSQLLAGSASPIVLPVIAVIVAATLPSTGLVTSIVERRGISRPDATASRIALEVSALLTAVIAVFLAVVLPAAGADTALIVLVIIGLGAAATSIWGGRRYGWWVAFASFTGALWCVWSLAEITLIEPYFLPPALSAALIGAISVARGARRAIGLYATGLAVAVIPTVVITAAVGTDEATVPWRPLALLLAAFVLIVLGTLLPKRPRRWADRLAPLAIPTLVLAIVAAAAGAIQGARWGEGLDLQALADPSSRMAPVLAYGIAAAGFAALAARQLLDTSRGSAPLPTRWVYAPAVVFLVLGPIFATARDPFAIWTLWVLMLAILVLLVVAVVRATRGTTSLPPAWFLFLVAFVTAVSGWSPREVLRVEGWSLVLGGMLLLAGVIAMAPWRSPTETTTAKTLNSWPVGYRGSWPTMWPGLVVIFSASIAATVTDPTTWRAVLVIAIALASLLVGSLVKLAAPFIVGLVVLPVEIIVVFAAQIGRNIESVPWWITLAVAAAVLLIIAVTSERRSGADGGIAARLRDLR
ncbi:MAG TPA: hypothetical protein VNT53_01915 [Pseudolysinimonas sp.]|nr:hypothetical protein [Pseudolysinimonas sp.]